MLWGQRGGMCARTYTIAMSECQPTAGGEFEYLHRCTRRSRQKQNAPILESVSAAE